MAMTDVNEHFIYQNLPHFSSNLEKGTCHGTESEKSIREGENMQMLVVMRSFILLMLSPPSRICSLAKIRSFAKVQICLRIVLFPSLHCSPSAFCLPWFIIFQIKKENYTHENRARMRREERNLHLRIMYYVLLVWDLTSLLTHYLNAMRNLSWHPLWLEETVVQREND